MKRFQAVLLAVILLAGFMAYAEAGVIITSIDTSFDDPRDSGTSTVYIGDNGMRVESRAEGESNTMIFRSDKEVFWIINTADKSYMEMTKKDIKKIKGQMDEAMRMMQEQMKNMPPEQRAMMEQMMKGKAMPAQPEKTVFKKVASGVKIGKWKCDKYEGYNGGQLTEEVCTTSWKSLGIEQKDFRVMKSMGEFMSELSPDAASQFNVGSDEWEKEQGYPGVPVRTISYSMGKKVFQTEIQDVKKQKIDSSLFELPKGLTKKSFTQ
ncbi:MAG: DUF4412 domain-containing protein [Thermodesulfovibrionia bacterium]